MIYNIIALGYLLYSLEDIYNYIEDVKDGLINWYAFTTCVKCLSFWGTLIITKGDITTAALVSLTVLILDTFIYTRI